MSHTKKHRYTGREIKARHLPVHASLRLDDGTVILSRSLVPFRTTGRPKHPRYRHQVGRGVPTAPPDYQTESL